MLSLISDFSTVVIAIISVNERVKQRLLAKAQFEVQRLEAREACEF